MTAPPENARRFPNLPLTRPVLLAAMIEEATKAVVGQLIRLAPPNSATMLGRSVAVINTFIECSSTPPNKTQRVSTRCHARSARQLVSVVTSRTTNSFWKVFSYFIMLPIKEAISFLIGCEHAVGEQQPAALHT
jgi:hypothetical protein